jgi:hypothetical protein
LALACRFGDAGAGALAKNLPWHYNFLVYYRIDTRLPFLGFGEGGRTV